MRYGPGYRRKNQITFDRNVVSEREFNKNFKGVFGTPECWKCEIPVSGSGEQHVGILKDFVKVMNQGGELLAPDTRGLKD